MRFDEKLKKKDYRQLWNEYCGFLDMSLSEYMYTQRRLMEEQINLWSACPLGQHLLKGKTPASLEDFLNQFPLTDYNDYADVLLDRRTEMLCSEPAIWIQTTWEGGLRPIKLAPYSRSMLDTYRHNLISTMMMASAQKKGDVNLRRGDRILYGGAPLPFATGLMPSLLDEDIHFTWLPDSNKNSDLSFSQRIKKGFAMAMASRIDFFFGIGSVANYITDSFGHSSGGHSGSLNLSISNAARFVKGKYISARDERPILPKDIFKLKAFFYAGTDASYYKSRLQRAWGAIPAEIAAGTESTCIGAETWERNGMVFFPDSCFYEFIPDDEMRKNLEDPSYTPRTVLMDGVRSGGVYEIVLSVLHGGAFMRYRIGDMYRCVSAHNDALPRFAFVDRVPNVIDIAGFTRITLSSMTEVLRLSRLSLGDWLLKKEYDAQDTPYLHMYLEIPPDEQLSEVSARAVLAEHISLYFRYFDSDYGDLKKMLNMEPLQITILKYGTIRTYESETKITLPRINPSQLDIDRLLKQQEFPATPTEKRDHSC